MSDPACSESVEEISLASNLAFGNVGVPKFADIDLRTSVNAINRDWECEGVARTVSW